MKIRFLTIYILLFALICGCFLIMFLHRSGAEGIPGYPTEINRLLLRLGEDWDRISGFSEEEETSSEPFDYAVVDAKGRLLLITNTNMAKSVSAATNHYDVIRDIVSGDEVVGKLIVHNPYMDAQKKQNRRMAMLMAGMACLTVLFLTSAFLILKKRVVDPFDKLEGFAEQVAGGNLETPLEMDRGNIFGAFTESFDIMREELKASRQREAEAVKSRKELVAQLSHDIKTPVASIKAMTDFMALSAEGEQAETLASITRKADQIDQLVANLFHATLEELEQLEVKPEEISSEELRKIIRESDHLKKVKNPEIRDCVFLADRLRLSQVVGNILANSYKYADTDITVESFFEDGYFVAEFSDRGGGVPEEEIEVIMEKFRRGSNAAGKDGSGLGLYISAYLMERMEGSLGCRNNGEGFTVTLRLKLV